MLTKTKLILLGIALPITFSMGALSMYLLEKPQIKTVYPEAEQRFSDGGLMLQTIPVPQIITKIIIPKTDKVVSQSNITLIPSLNQETNPKPTTTLPAIKETVDVVKEKNGNERVIVQAPGYTVNGSDEVLNKEIVIPNPKKEINLLVGYDFFRNKEVYGIQYKMKLGNHFSVSSLIIGSTVSVGVGVCF